MNQLTTEDPIRLSTRDHRNAPARFAILRYPENAQLLIPHFLSTYAAPFIGAYVLTIVVYSYFFFGIIFSDHTFPNVWVWNYPSYKTLSEGRWFEDILYLAFGGSGVQSVQMAIATALQVINAFILASLLRVVGGLRLFLVAAFLSLHPAFLDYYSYSNTHIAWVAGDTLALLGTLALDRIGDRRIAIPMASLAFLLTLATYQPKIALIALLLLIWSIGATQRLSDGSSTSAVRCLLHLRDSILALGTALALYLVSIRLTIRDSAGFRTTVNNANEVIRQLIQSYPAILKHFTLQVDYLPSFLAWLPAAVLLLGVAVLLLRAWRGGNAMLALTIGLVILIPPALRASYVINSQTWQNVGRILSPHAYLLILFLMTTWSVDLLRRAGIVACAVLIYCFAVVASQETNAAALQTIYDLSKINRIVSRIEELGPDAKSVVIVGHLPLVPRVPFRRYENRLYRSNKAESFAAYRHVDILNFFLGRERITWPKEAEVEAALAGVGARRPWPAPESVFMKDGVVVVLLETYAPGVDVTWTQERFGAAPERPAEAAQR